MTAARCRAAFLASLVLAIGAAQLAGATDGGEANRRQGSGGASAPVKPTRTAVPVPVGATTSKAPAAPAEAVVAPAAPPPPAAGSAPPPLDAPPPTGAPAPSSATPAATAAAADAATNKRLAALRKKVLRDDDFVENDEINRDPFHSYLRLFVDHGAPKNHRAPAVFDKVGLEELALIAIVSGDETPRAMFRDATGYGQSVKKGDFLSRSGARVTKILSDRVIVEITETSGTGEPRVVEKAILVNPDEAP